MKRCLSILIPLVLFAADPIDPLVVGNNQFALEFYRQMAGSGGNIVVSPFAISESLALAYAGSGGSTKAVMQKVLHLPNRSREKVLQSFHNLSEEASPFQSVAGIWFPQGQPLLAAYRTLLGPNLHEGVFSQPSMLAVEINQWMSDQTHAQIRQLIEPIALGDRSEIALASGAVISTGWLFPFDAHETKDNVMHGVQRLPYMENSEVAMCALPMQAKHLTLLLFVPKGRLSAFEEGLTLEKLAGLMQKMEVKAVKVELPMFHAATRVYAREFLERMGMQIAFSPSADFSGIDAALDLKITTVVHEAHLTLSERGMGAASGYSEMPRFTGEAEATFNAEAPFFYILLDVQTGQYLLLGRLSEAG